MKRKPTQLRGKLYSVEGANFNYFLKLIVINSHSLKMRCYFRSYANDSYPNCAFIKLNRANCFLFLYYCGSVSNNAKQNAD